MPLPFSRNPNLCPFNTFFPSHPMWRLHVWFFVSFSIALENSGYMCGTSWLWGTLCIKILEGLSEIWMSIVYLSGVWWSMDLRRNTNKTRVFERYWGTCSKLLICSRFNSQHHDRGDLYNHIIRPLYTRTKNHDHENLRALKNHPKATP